MDAWDLRRWFETPGGRGVALVLVSLLLALCFCCPRPGEPG